jgi:hypothetical protein
VIYDSDESALLNAGRHNSTWRDIGGICYRCLDFWDYSSRPTSALSKEDVRLRTSQGA